MKLDNIDHHEINIIPGAIRRPFSKADLPQMITFDSFAMLEKSDTPPDHAPPHLRLDEIDEALAKGDVMGGVYTASNEMVGYYWFEPRPTKGYMYISSIAVHPSYRDRGLGVYFLTLAETEARKRKLLKCTLSVDPLNGRAVNVYLKHGYRIVEYKEAYFGKDYPNTDRFLMEKDLDDKQEASHTEERMAFADDPVKLKQILSEKFRGVELIRAINGNNRKNKIRFQR